MFLLASILQPYILRDLLPVVFNPLLMEFIITAHNLAITLISKSFTLTYWFWNYFSWSLLNETIFIDSITVTVSDNLICISPTSIRRD